MNVFSCPSQHHHQQQHLSGDSRDVALLRCLLAQTRIEKEPLLLAYDAGALGFVNKRVVIT